MALTEHLEKLLGFNMVVKVGSIRKAAEQLNQTQPALSRSIAVLEAALECRLFTRDRSGVQLTHQGSELFTFSEKIFREAAAVEHKLTYGDEDLESSFLIGTYDSIAIYFFPYFLKYTQELQSKLQINIRTAGSPQLMKDLKGGHVDLIVSVNPEPSKNIITHTLFLDQFSFYSRLATEDEHPTFITVPSALDRTGKTIQDYTKQFGINKNKMIHCENFETVRALTDAGLGVGIMPTRVAGRNLPQIKNLKKLSPKTTLPLEFGTHMIGFSYLKSRESNSSVQWIFREMLRYLSRTPTP